MRFNKKLVVRFSLALSIITLSAFAGTHFSGWEVSLSGNGTTGGFSGSPGAARHSADAYQWIGCEVIYNQSSPLAAPSAYGNCFARDAKGNTRSCYVSIKGAALTAAVLSNLKADSYLEASYYTEAGNAYCSYVRIHNTSAAPYAEYSSTY